MGREGGREKERALETSVHRREGARRVEGERGERGLTTSEVREETTTSDQREETREEKKDGLWRRAGGGVCVRVRARVCAPLLVPLLLVLLAAADAAVAV